MDFYKEFREDIVKLLADKSCSWRFAYPPNLYYKGIVNKNKFFKNIDFWSKNPLTRKYGIFIYIPFCKYNCKFCIYYKDKKNTNYTKYINKLAEDIYKLSIILKNKKLELDNIYIGGGTPTVLNYNDLEKIFLLLKNCFNLKQMKQFSIEATPDSLDTRKIKLLYKYGITRIGFGLQSVNDKVLKENNRLHSTSELYKKIIESRRIGIKAIHIDLIVGLPEEDILDKNYIKNVINYLKKINPEHIDIYSYKQSGKRRDNIYSTKFSDFTINNIRKKIILKLEKENFFVGTNYKGSLIYSNEKIPDIVGINRNSEGKYFDLSIIGLGITGISSLYGKKFFMNLMNLASSDGENFKETILNKDEMIRRKIISDLNKNKQKLNIKYYTNKFNIDLVSYLNNNCLNIIKKGFLIKGKKYISLEKKYILDFNLRFDLIFNHFFSNNIRKKIIEYIKNRQKIDN